MYTFDHEIMSKKAYSQHGYDYQQSQTGHDSPFCINQLLPNLFLEISISKRFSYILSYSTAFTTSYNSCLIIYLAFDLSSVGGVKKLPVLFNIIFLSVSLVEVTVELAVITVAEDLEVSYQ